MKSLKELREQKFKNRISLFIWVMISFIGFGVMFSGASPKVYFVISGEVILIIGLLVTYSILKLQWKIKKEIRSRNPASCEHGKFTVVHDDNDAMCVYCEKIFVITNHKKD